MNRLILSVLLLCSCQFETQGFEDLVGGGWDATMRCGGDEVPMQEGVPLEMGGWTCTSQPPVSHVGGAELRVSCENGDARSGFGYLCIGGTPAAQWSTMSLPGGCEVQLNCSADGANP